MFHDYHGILFLLRKIPELLQKGLFDFRLVRGCSESVRHTSDDTDLVGDTLVLPTFDLV